MESQINRLAIMQPYFLPYIGYFQLIAAVDKFVVFDDVNYINRGWINRNRMLINGTTHTFTIPLQDSSQNKSICDITLCDETKWRDKLLRTFLQAYCKAPNFNPVYDLLNLVFNYPTTRLDAFLVNNIQEICNYLDLKTNITPTSRIYGNSNLKGQDRILDICQLERAKEYINPIGGIELYNHAEFSRRQIKLQFLKSRTIVYSHGKYPFTPWLSIVDVLMFNSKHMVKSILLEYDLLE